MGTRYMGRDDTILGWHRIVCSEQVMMVKGYYYHDCCHKLSYGLPIAPQNRSSGVRLEIHIHQSETVSTTARPSCLELQVTISNV